MKLSISKINRGRQTKIIENDLTDDDCLTLKQSIKKEVLNNFIELLYDTTTDVDQPHNDGNQRKALTKKVSLHIHSLQQSNHYEY